MHSIIRAYDIRGEFGTTLTLPKIKTFCQKFCDFLPSNTSVGIARDGRLHSPHILDCIVNTLLDQGVHVIDIGCVPTPLLWFFLKNNTGIDAGIMITASHNPPKDNGLKIALKDHPLTGDDFWNILECEEKKRAEKGTYHKQDIVKAYCDFLQKNTNIHNKKVIWDSGHGVAGPVISKLFPHDLILYKNIDGSFPAHPPDPTKEKNMKDLGQKVRAKKADLGIGIDGDGDRMGVVNSKGELIQSELILSAFAKDILSKNKGVTFVGDIKSSSIYKQSVEENGGKFILCKTGHSYIKKMMIKHNAIFGGEASGHIFFNDRYFGYDDAIYSSLRLLELSISLDDLYNPYKLYDQTIQCNDNEKFFIVENIKKKLHSKKISFIDIDGIRCESEKGWWLIRASNTESLLTCRCEAKTQKDLEELKTDMLSYLN